MKTDVGMTEFEVRQQVERTDRIAAAFRRMVAATRVDPPSPCTDDHRRGLQRIGAPLDAVPHVTKLQFGKHQHGNARPVAGSDLEVRGCASMGAKYLSGPRSGIKPR